MPARGGNDEFSRVAKLMSQSKRLPDSAPGLGSVSSRDCIRLRFCAPVRICAWAAPFRL